MVFSSLLFLFRFLPCVLFIYLLTPGCMGNVWRNLVLFASSLLFYAWGEPVYVVLMLFSTVVDYVNGGLAGYFVHRGRRGLARTFVALSVIVNLSLLCVFKYGGFLAGLWGRVSGMEVSWHELPLPVGISFYTFQTVSYTIDVYRGGAEPEKNIINFGAYVAMFPQLIAGPIVRYRDIGAQLRGRRVSAQGLSDGAVRFVAGLGKKVLLANQAGEIFKTVTGFTQQMTSAAAWLGIFAFFMQVYFDFSGYSDMAIGLMKMFGFQIPENFRYPYESKSISEFWRRWHISLGTWFKEYVYIPLGGNRRGRGRTLFNLFLVWFLTGLWHGAGLHFIAWGLWFGFFVMLEKAWLADYLQRIPAWLAHVYAMGVVMGGWVLFAWEDIPYHRLFVKALLLRAPAGLVNRATMYVGVGNALLLIIMCIGATSFPRRIYCRLVKSGSLDILLKTAGVAAILLCSIAYLVNGTYNPFLYFRF